MNNLWSKVECLRQKMHAKALEKGISHPDVLTVSQRLDKLINESYNAGTVKKMVLVQKIK